MLIDWFTVVAQAINFLILVWLLKRFLYKPVLAAIDEREKRIAAQLQDAESKKANAAKEQADLSHKNKEFDEQRSKLLLDATNAAKTEKDTLMAAARKDSEDLRTKLQKAVHDELDSLNQKLGTLARHEVFATARKTLSDLAGVSLEERMVDVFIRRLREMKDQQRDELKTALHNSTTPVVVRSAFDLAPPQKALVNEAIKSLLGDTGIITFETKPDLISGIELSANGQKICWSIADYLTTLASSVDALLQPQAASDPVAQKVVLRAA